MTDTDQTATLDPEANGALVPPYFAFKTLINQLDFMKERATPNRIDRSFLIGMSGAAQTQYMTGMRSLGLIDTAGVVQAQLKELVNASVTERKRLLATILHERYAKAIELGQTNATTGQLVDLFREEYGASGDTARKGIAFFLNAARYADVSLSPMFQTPKISLSGTRKRKPKVNGGPSDDPAMGKPADPTPQGIPMPEFHPTLAGVLMEFPTRGRGWTKDRREKTLAMFTMAVDFTIPVVDTEPEIDEDDDLIDDQED